METCPICDFKATIHKMDDDGPLQILCDRCGEFIISKEAVNFYKDNKQNDWQSKLSFWIRNHQGGNIKIDIKMLRDLPNRIKLPHPFEQVNNFLLWLGTKLGDNYGDEIELDFEILTSIIGSKTIGDVEFVLEHLKNEKLIHIESASGNWSSGLTFKGWEKFDELNKPTRKTKAAFMAMKYGEQELEGIFNNDIAKAVKETGFEIELLRSVLKAGSIDDQLRLQIRRSKFLIADLTHINEGAYWEAGYAEGLGKPVIYFCKRSIFQNAETKPHFDTNHLTTVLWEKETIEDDMNNLKAIIRNTFPTEALMED